VLWAPGNHDYDREDPSRRATTLWNSFIPQSWYTSRAWFHGGFYDSTNSYNVYEPLTNGASRLLLFALEFGPRTNVLCWVSNVAAMYPDHTVIVATHNYLQADGMRDMPWDQYDPLTAYGLADAATGDGVWWNLAGVPNLHFIVSGHNLGQELGGYAGGCSHNIAVGTHGNWVNEQFNNWQLGTSSRVVLWNFYPARQEVLAETFDPRLNQFYREPANEWSMPMGCSLPARAAEQPLVIRHQPADVTIAPGGPARATFAVAVSGSPPVAYQWRWNGSDLEGKTTPRIILRADKESAGSYSVVISNSAGSVTSAVATLKISADQH
jgi:hypothetical protein